MILPMSAASPEREGVSRVSGGDPRGGDRSGIDCECFPRERG